MGLVWERRRSGLRRGGRVVRRRCGSRGGAAAMRRCGGGWGRSVSSVPGAFFEIGPVPGVDIWAGPFCPYRRMTPRAET
jgi:hypothetical protein